MAEPEKPIGPFTRAERDNLSQAVAVYCAVLRRRVNGEVNQSIKEILAKQLREVEALTPRL